MQIKKSRTKINRVWIWVMKEAVRFTVFTVLVCSCAATVVENKCVEIYLVVKRVRASAAFHGVFQTTTRTAHKFAGVYRFSIWLTAIAL